jgi:hypothetical protein
LEIFFFIDLKFGYNVPPPFGYTYGQGAPGFGGVVYLLAATFIVGQMQPDFVASPPTTRKTFIVSPWL